jgi:hypothetical protein
LKVAVLVDQRRAREKAREFTTIVQGALVTDSAVVTAYLTAARRTIISHRSTPVMTARDN